MTDASTKGSLKGEALRSAILDAAATLFIERGTGGTSMQDIAEALGLSRTAVYYYFKNKDAILRALTEEVLNTARKLAGDTVARADLDPVQALGALVTQHADLILSRPAEFRSGRPHRGRHDAQAARGPAGGAAQPAGELQRGH